MKVQFFLLGAVVALTLGALSSASLVPVGSHSKAATAKPAATSSPEIATSSASAAPDANAGPDSTSKTHPCNHGFYVSQVAHQHKGGKFVSQVAQGDLG